MSHHNDIASLLTAIYASLESGEMSAWENHLADDAICIGTDEEEWLQGKATIVPVMRAQVSEMSAAGISVTGGEALSAEQGELVVVADRPTIHLPDGSATTVRVTLAGRQVDGEVLIHQMHLSVPAPNAEVLQTELTVPS
ncbi:MAG: nuclear transport factor 2 family protein [Beijerinckiaceae bacterium]|nr:nuclear transport factor 2 family protein [Beijerinckiaceae bacterium]